MECPACGAATVVFAVPPDLREYAPEAAAAAALCTNCLSLSPADPAAASSEPDFSRLSEAFPQTAAVPTALLVGLVVDSLVLHRAAIEALLERVERAGVDPFLLLDRLATSSSLSPRTDLARRRTQLEQLL